MLALKCDFFFQGPTIKIRMFTYSWKCEEVPQRTIECPIALQLDPPPTPSHSAPPPPPQSPCRSIPILLDLRWPESLVNEQAVASRTQAV